MNEFSLSDLEHLPSERLTAVQAKITSILRGRRAREKKKATKRIVELAAQHGINLNEVARPKCYRNPHNQFEEWSGRGPHPKWVQAHISKGGSLADLAVTP